MKERREAIWKSSRLLAKSKLVPPTETPEETESVAKGEAKDKEGKDMKRTSLLIGGHLDDGIQNKDTS